MGYRPVMKAALLGVHRGDAARCCVSFTPSAANRSILGVLERKTHVIHDDLETCSFHCGFLQCITSQQSRESSRSVGDAGQPIPVALGMDLPILSRSHSTLAGHSEMNLVQFWAMLSFHSTSSTGNAAPASLPAWLPSILQVLAETGFS